MEWGRYQWEPTSPLSPGCGVGARGTRDPPCEQGSSYRWHLCVGNKYPASLPPLPNRSVTGPAAPLPPVPHTGARNTRLLGSGCPPQLLPQTPAPVHPPGCSVHTQSLLFPLTQHLDAPHAHVCSHTRCSHTRHTHRVHPSQCYLLTSARCTPTLAPAHAHTWCTLTSAALTHSTHSVPVHTRSCCCLAHGTHSVPVHTRSCCCLTPGAHPVLGHARFCCRLTSCMWCTLIPGAHWLRLLSHT